MIISRTPLRISFVGGGTDIKSFYQNSYGMVLNTSINKYLYVIVKRQIGIVEFKYRINWSTVEFCHKIDDIKHPIAREVLKYFEIDFPIEITTISDIPASSGMGSSSTFAVGLINAILALLKIQKTKYQIASLASKIEIDILKRNIGKQDHFAATYGNLNIFKFYPDETVEVLPVYYGNKTKELIENNILLFWTKISRNASNILSSVDNNSLTNKTNLEKIRDLVYPLNDIFLGKSEINEFGLILDKAWQLKKTLSPNISIDQIDEIYNKAKNLGAIGGKILGAGGGGFLLLYVEKNNQKKVINALNNLPYFKFKFDKSGTRITYYDTE